VNEAVAHQIWNYIGMLGVDRETARDLYQEAETAIWEASAYRATRKNHTYLVKTGVGAIRHWLRDRYSIIRVPGYLYDRGQATEHIKVILPLEVISSRSGEEMERPELGIHFEDDLLEQISVDHQRAEVIRLLPRLTRAERQVMESLLAGMSIKEIARRRGVRVGIVYTQRNKAITKLRQLVVGENVPPPNNNRPMKHEQVQLQLAAPPDIRPAN